tara:strand:+ start:3947 stop:5347 length:1401 start_codon:yes stop_codon:yes gene_type:complete
MKKNDILKNNTICPLAFNHAYVGPTYVRKLCCISEPLEGHEKSSLEEYWNSSDMKQIRLDMINNIPVDYCNICYEKEKTDIPSYRQTALAHEAEHNVSGGHWLTEQAILDGTAELPSHFDYRTIHCNLTCNHCSPVYSSEHIRLRDTYTNDGFLENNGNSFKIDKNFEESMLNDLITSVDNRKLDRIYFAGGEPMMSPFHWKFIDHLKNIHDNEDSVFVKNINIYYNTNLTKSTWKNQNVYEYLKFLKPMIHASIDGVGKTFEYVRKGGKWDTVKENFESGYKNLSSSESKGKNNGFGVQPVILSHNIFSMDEMLSFFEKFENLYIQPMTLVRHFPEFTGQQRWIYNCYPGYLDPVEFPEEIMLPAIEKAIKRVKQCPLAGAENIIPILEQYKIEIDKLRPICEKHEQWSFARTKMMEKHTTLSLNSLLKEINTEAWMWYNGINRKYENLDITEYKFFDSLENINE